MSIGKNDQAARDHWGAAYDAIPKSVFAVAAWHLANVASETCDALGAAEGRFAEELEALAGSGILEPRQAKAALKALSIV
jgi:hypothetical protein